MPSFWPSADPFYVTYYELCRDLMSRAPEVVVRGKKTKELIASGFTVDPQQPLTGRAGFSDKFALTETLQVITGRGDIRQLAQIAPQFASMAPSYVTYGPRAAWQLQVIHDKLKADPLTRQAILQIYQPEDLYKPYPECPCTMSLQFLARPFQEEIRLHLIATMRSNDIWFGTPTDVFMFTFLQRQMAASLGMLVGDYTHQAGSLHVYEEHWDKLEAHLEINSAMPAPPRLGLHLRPYGWDIVRVKASEVLEGERPGSTWIEGLKL